MELESIDVGVREGLDEILDFINFFEEPSPEASKLALDFLKNSEIGRKNVELSFPDGSSIFVSLFKNINGDYLMLACTDFNSLQAYYKLNYE